MAEAVFRCFFPGRVRLFGKTGSHSRESRATNAAGKNALSQRRNKAERNCRHTQGTQQIKSRSCRTVFLCGSFCFSVLICTPNTGWRVLLMGYARKDVERTKMNAKKFVRYQEGAEKYSLGLTKFQELAKEAKAVYKIDKVALVNCEIFERYLETFRIA